MTKQTLEELLLGLGWRRVSFDADTFLKEQREIRLLDELMEVYDHPEWIVPYIAYYENLSLLGVGKLQDLRNDKVYRL